jgi:hypothetical protein
VAITVGQRSRLTSIPKVFIVESLKFDDEKEKRFEGRFIGEMLRLSGSGAHYVYIRTETELEEVLDQFEDSKYRYLHFSCHGNRNGIGLTLDDLPFAQLGRLLKPVIDERRVFFSSCEVMNNKLAKALLPGSGCYSVIGPSRSIHFDRAAIFWASFYHVMLRDEAKSMKRSDIRETVSTLRRAFAVPIRYFSATDGAPGYKEVNPLTVSLTEPSL